MKTGLKNEAFTIVETLIVLAVTSLLLISASIFVTGQQAKTEFSQSINNIKSQIDTVINNVSTGYYSRSSNFTCTNSGGPRFGTGTAIRGSNQACIYIGRAMHFSVGGVDQNFNLYNLVGLRLASDGDPVQDTSEADPTALSPGNTTNNYNPPFPALNTTQSNILGWGLKAKRMYYLETSASAPPAPGLSNTGVLAFVTDFASFDSDGNLSSSSRNADLFAIAGTGLTTSAVNAVDAINSSTTVTFKKVYAVVICFEGGVNKKGTITIGGNNRQLTTDLQIGSGPC